MPNSAMLNVSWASEAESPSAARTAGITGMNRCTASGPINEIAASANANSGPGSAVMFDVAALRPKFLHRAVGLIDRGVGICHGARVRVSDRDAAEARPPDHVRLVAFR